MANHDWEESEHPRDNIGRFTDKGSTSSNSSKEEKKQEIIRKNNEEKARIEHIADILYPKTKDKNKNPITNKSASTYIKPVDGKITSDFGYRIAPTKGASIGHSGIDIKVPVGTPVKSIANGKVVAARSGMQGYGVGVFIDHGIINGNHVVSEYGHLSEYNVKIGDELKQGQIFAKSGNTGISTGPHLHLTIRENGKPVDPRKYLDF